MLERGKERRRSVSPLANDPASHDKHHTSQCPPAKQTRAVRAQAMKGHSQHGDEPLVVVLWLVACGGSVAFVPVAPSSLPPSLRRSRMSKQH